ncbi:MAG: hypothetical protein JO122_17610 [Acetobacteraceae bacterium]|nr:hypothetical protein [Acetobacteraceae bacterium]
MDQEQNTPVDFSELVNSFEFVSSGSRGECEAYLSLDTGQFYWRSDITGDDELPEHLDESDRYIAVPHKNELDLGRDLVIAFTEQEMPDEVDRVWDFFGRRGAYRRFKDLLEYRSLLEKWYDYENRAAERALREWCEENGIPIKQGSRDVSPEPRE